MPIVEGMENKQLGLTVFATSLAFLLVQLDVSIINVSLAAIGARWQVGVLGLQWVVDSYALAFASLLLSTGALGDRLGHRRVFILGLALFTGASVACGLAWSETALVAARVFQGAGAAALVPSSLALLTRACGDDGKLRAWGVGWWTASGTVGLAAGPLLGGVLVDLLGWRSIFLVNLPVGLLGIWLTRRFVAASTPSETRLDWIGQALAIVALLSLTGTGDRGPSVRLVVVPCLRRADRRHHGNGRLHHSGAPLQASDAAVEVLLRSQVLGRNPGRLPDQHDPLRSLVRAGPLFPGD